MSSGAVSIPYGQRSMSLPIIHIFLMRPPGKIDQPIVLGVAIEVTAFHSIGARSNEGRQHQSMNKLNCLCAIFEKMNTRITTPLKELF
jgi:hypothetical protein